MGEVFSENVRLKGELSGLKKGRGKDDDDDDDMK